MSEEQSWRDMGKALLTLEVNTILKDANNFRDHVTLRRELIDHRLLTRKSDCSEYRKLAARPDDDRHRLGVHQIPVPQRGVCVDPGPAA
jgi:hypothetical protein